MFEDRIEAQEVMSQAFLGTSRQAFAGFLAGSEHCLPVLDFAGYCGEVYDMITNSMNDDPPRERVEEFVTFEPAVEEEVFDRLPARFRRQRHSHVWRRKQIVKQ